MALEIILGFIYCSILEWWLHKVPLHKSFLFKDHLEHHKLTGKDMIDAGYFTSIFGTGESLFSIFLIILHFPVFFISKYIYITFIFYIIFYLVLHRFSHTNINFCKK